MARHAAALAVPSLPPLHAPPNDEASTALIAPTAPTVPPQQQASSAAPTAPPTEPTVPPQQPASSGLPHGFTPEICNAQKRSYTVYRSPSGKVFPSKRRAWASLEVPDPSVQETLEVLDPSVQEAHTETTAQGRGLGSTAHGRGKPVQSASRGTKPATRGTKSATRGNSSAPPRLVTDHGTIALRRGSHTETTAL